MSVAKDRAAVVASLVSRTTARATTMPTAPSSPCARRSATSTSTLGATAQSADATANPVAPSSIGRRRPSTSDSGPATSWPRARPSRHEVSESCVTEGVVARSAVSVGSAGR
jgi:hypothetical protein